jgi:hypothetical protein
MLRKSPVAREFLRGDNTANLCPTSAALDTGRVVAEVAVQNRYCGGLQDFRKGLLGGRELKPGTAIKTSDGRTGTFRAKVGENLALVEIGGWTSLIPYSALEVFDASGGEASTNVPAGRQGGYPGAGASLDANKLRNFYSSPEGMLALLKTTVSASPAPSSMGFAPKSDLTPRFQRGDRVLHRPSGRRGRFVASQSGTHSHISLDDGSLLTCRNEEVEKDEGPTFAGAPGLPPFVDAGRVRVSLSASADKAAYFASAAGQHELAKLFRSSSSSGAAQAPSAVPERPGSEAGLREARASIEALWAEVLTRARESDAPRPLVKAQRFRPGDYLEHQPSGRRCIFIAPASESFSHVKLVADGGRYVFSTDELKWLPANGLAGYSGLRRH